MRLLTGIERRASLRLSDALYLFFQLNVWLSLGSGLMVAIAARALGIPLSAVGLGVALPPLLFYVIYVEDRRSVSDEDWTNRPTRTRLVRRYRYSLLGTEVLALLGYELLLVSLVGSNPQVGYEYVLLGHLPFAVLAAYDRIKRRPGFDSTAVACTWSFAVVFAVSVASAQAVSRETAVVFLAWFAVVFAGVESRNVQDIEGDSDAGKPTLAALLGRERTRLLVVASKAIGVALFWSISGIAVAGSVVGYLALLWLFRRLTERTAA